MARQTGTGYLENTTQAPLSSSNGPWFWGMWIKLDNTSQTLKYLAYLGNSGTIQTAWIYNFVTNKTELYLAGGSGTDPRSSSQITLNNTNWNHIAMRKNASGASSFDLFLNGTKTVGNASINFTFGAHSWSLYGAAAGGYNKTAASFAECIAIPAAPSDDQVAALAKGASGLSLGCLLKNGSYYPFIGRNSTECDIVGGRSMTTTSTNTVDHLRIFYSRPVDELTTKSPVVYTLIAEQGSFSLIGQVAGLLSIRKIPAAQGSYTITDQTVGLVATRLLASDVGLYSLSGQDVGLGRGFTITAGQGSYTLTGQSAGLLATRIITAAQGSYSLTGQAAGLIAARTITAIQGNYSLSGQAAVLLKTSVITADVGSIALNGQSVDLRRGFGLMAGSGSYALNGQDAGLTRTYVVACDYGSYAVDGQDSGLIASRVLTSDGGTYSLTGQDAGLFAGRTFAAAVGEFTLTGQSVSLVVAVPMRTRCVSLSAAASYSTTVVAYSRNASVTAAATYSAVGAIDRC